MKYYACINPEIKNIQLFIRAKLLFLIDKFLISDWIALFVTKFYF